jgi:hypothetical protein
MSSKRFLAARVMVIVLLVLLAFQFELGVAVNIANPKSIPPFSLSSTAVTDALNGVGVVAVIHASLGSLLVLVSLVSIILALRTGVLGVQVFGCLALVATCLALTTGLMFTLSGFQNDGLSHGMATMFLLSFSFNFLELYFLKPAPKIQKE